MKEQIVTFDWVTERGNLLLIDNTPRKNDPRRAKTLHAALLNRGSTRETYLNKLYLYEDYPT